MGHLPVHYTGTLPLSGFAIFRRPPVTVYADVPGGSDRDGLTARFDQLRRHTTTMETYDIAEHTHSATENEPFLKTVAKAVDREMAEIGYQTDTVALTTPEAGTDVAKAGRHITPKLSDTVLEAMDSGMAWLSFNEDLADYFGRSRGSSNVATIAIEEGLGPAEIIGKLQEATYDGTVGQIDKAVHLFDLMRKSTDPRAEQIVAYTMMQKLSGIEAERILTNTGAYKKGNVAQDEGGIDLWKGGEAKQLKTLTRAASDGIGEFQEKEIDHIFYGFAGGKMVVGTEEDVAGTDEVASKLKKHLGLSTKTITKKSHNAGVLKDYPRPARILW